MTGERTLALNPVVYGYKADPIALGMDLIASYGVTNKFDIWVNFGSITVYPVFYDNFWVMARHDLGGSNIIAFKVNNLSASIQYHGCLENKAVYLQSNAAITCTYETYSDINFKAIISPGVKIRTSGWDIFCDVIPSYTIKQDFGLTVTPGFGFSVFGDLFSVGVTLKDVTGNMSPLVGIWYFHAFLF